MPYCFWNGVRKSEDSLNEIVYLYNFLVDNGTIAPDFIYGEVYVEFDSSDILDYLWEKGHYSITGEAEYSPMYGYSFSASNYEMYLTIESILD